MSSALVALGVLDPGTLVAGAAVVASGESTVPLVLTVLISAGSVLVLMAPALRRRLLGIGAIFNATCAWVLSEQTPAR